MLKQRPSYGCCIKPPVIISDTSACSLVHSCVVESVETRHGKTTFSFFGIIVLCLGMISTLDGLFASFLLGRERATEDVRFIISSMTLTFFSCSSIAEIFVLLETDCFRC